MGIAQDGINRKVARRKELLRRTKERNVEWKKEYVQRVPDRYAKEFPEDLDDCFIRNKEKGVLMSAQQIAADDPRLPEWAACGVNCKGGFNIFRRLRITYLQTEGCPEVLRHFWSGHAQTHVEERYTRLAERRDYRLGQAEKLGAGFNLGPLGPRGAVVEFRRTAMTYCPLSTI